MTKKQRNIVLFSTAGITALGAFYYLSTNIKIWLLAKFYLGKKEISPNAGFYSKGFAKKLEKVGFVKSYDWCALFVKLVLKEALTGKKKRIVQDLMNASSQSSWANFKNSKEKFIKVVTKPRPGDVAFWKWTDKDYSGHVEIVNSVSKNGFTAISGNSPLTVGGQGVAKRERTFAYSGVPFKLLGFIRIS